MLRRVRCVVAVGSCATGARESGQVRKEAAFSGNIRVLQIAWPLPQSAPPTVTVCSAPHHRAFGTLHEVGHAQFAREALELP